MAPQWRQLKPHRAGFPIQIPYRLIKMFSYVGDCILDPFLGSGTTTVAAMTLSRNSVGCEVEPSFAALIERRVGESINTSLLKGRWVRRRSLHFRVKVNVNYLEQQSIYA